MVNKVEKFEDVAAVIRVYEENIQTKISNIVGINTNNLKCLRDLKKRQVYPNG